MKDIQIAGLTINEALYNLVDKEITPGTGITAESFFTSLSAITTKFASTNIALLNERDRLQARIDEYFTDLEYSGGEVYMMQPMASLAIPT